MKYFIPGCIQLFFALQLTAQKVCMHNEYVQQLTNAQPALKEKIKQATQQSFDAALNYSLKGGTDNALPGVITVPVVIHFLYNSENENTSDALIASQLEALNRDFNGANDDKKNIPAYFAPLYANISIRFELAKIDPQGYATTGVIRKKTNIVNYGVEDRCKFTSQGGDDAWNANEYLNIWVCGTSALGYASPIGCPAERDGIVINSSVFGTIGKQSRYGNGRTGTHEVGHWLGLKHIWGEAYCGDDGVDDTPQQKTSNKGMPSGIRQTCGNTTYGDMYMNYMDLVDDPAMLMFSAGQKTKMRNQFLPGAARNKILFSKAITGIPKPTPVAAAIPPVIAALKVYPNPASNYLQLVTNESKNLRGKVVHVYNQLGMQVHQQKITGSNAIIDITKLKTGQYYIKLEDDSKLVLKFMKL
jgi:Secretion system C-terminal sorting domain/Pregnancy-associated plasma protein-A